MPEIPDITLYIETLEPRTIGQPIIKARVSSPFVLRTVDPPLHAIEGKRVRAISRLGKQIVFEIEGDLFLVMHLMIAGRLRWRDVAGASDAKKAPKISPKMTLATLEFPTGMLYLTEAGTTRRASLRLVQGSNALRASDRGGIDPMSATLAEFVERLRVENHTLKRSLTDPRLFSGIGNAYSDEILHRARLSPTAHSARLSDADAERLYQATRETLADWIDRLRAEVGDGFPEKVTAFREGMAVHGRFGMPCPDCGTPVQRIRYASNETNYCARCQTGGRLLADRALSRLLKQDWPKSIDDVE